MKIINFKKIKKCSYESSKKKMIFCTVIKIYFFFFNILHILDLYFKHLLFIGVYSKKKNKHFSPLKFNKKYNFSTFLKKTRFH